MSLFDWFGGGEEEGAAAAPGGRATMPMRFERDFKCFSVTYLGKPGLEGGDKVVLPGSALDMLTRLHVQYPMLFSARDHMGRGNVVHCGVIEFSAPEGRAFFPSWLMRVMGVGEGDLVRVANVSLPKCTYVKLRPQSKEFLDLSDPKAALEFSLRSYSCLTKGGQLCFFYNDKPYWIDVVDCKPTDAVSIIETDMSVEFAPPPGMEDEKPSTSASASTPAASSSASSSSAATSSSSSSSAEVVPIRDIKTAIAAARVLRARKEMEKRKEEGGVPKVFVGVGVKVGSSEKVEGAKVEEAKTASIPNLEELRQWEKEAVGGEDVEEDGGGVRSGSGIPKGRMSAAAAAAAAAAASGEDGLENGDDGEGDGDGGGGIPSVLSGGGRIIRGGGGVGGGVGGVKRRRVVPPPTSTSTASVDPPPSSTATTPASSPAPPPPPMPTPSPSGPNKFLGKPLFQAFSGTPHVPSAEKK